jgi:DNA-binding NtrC family response regulator
LSRQTTVTLDLTGEPGASLPYLCRIFPARAGALPPLSCVERACVLGRAEGDGVSLALDDVRVSRRHAEVTSNDDGDWRIHDLGSKNGLFIDGERVETAPLTEGSRIRIGNSLLLFRRLTVDAPPPLPRGLSFYGTSVALRRVEEACRRAAPTNATLLLRGPTGSGKEVFARYVHQASGRPGPFVPVNCAAVSEALFESAFFGHRKGAFTGAAADFEGFARSAEGGTLFLDEVAEMTPEVQAKLLRFLDSGEVTPVGSTGTRRVDVRIVAATNQDLEARMADGRFRPDLFARLAGRQIPIPPLSHRPEDVIEIALRRLPDGLTPDAAEALVLHDWPFNVRELQSVLDAARADAPEGTPLPVSALPPAIRVRVTGRSAAPSGSDSATRPAPDSPAAPPKAGILGADGPTPERAAFEALVRECDGNVSEVARRLGKERRQVYRWLHRFGLKERS